MSKQMRYDGLGIAMLGLSALLLTGLALSGFIRAPAAVDDTSVQQSMAWSSWAMVAVSIAAGIIGGLSLYLIYRTLQAAQRSAVAAERTLDETRLIGRAQTRAYLSATEFQLSEDSLSDATIKFTLSNAGQSPALTIRAQATIRVQRNGLVEHTETHHREITALAAGAAIPVTIFYSSDLQLGKILGAPGSSLGAHFVLFSVEFEVRYLDVFNDHGRQELFLQVYAASGRPGPYIYPLIERI